MARRGDETWIIPREVERSTIAVPIADQPGTALHEKLYSLDMGGERLKSRRCTKPIGTLARGLETTEADSNAETR